MSEGAASTATARIVWFEMPARDTAQAQRFHGDLFGWSLGPDLDGNRFGLHQEAPAP